jgi:hypothetical protein
MHVSTSSCHHDAGKNILKNLPYINRIIIPWIFDPSLVTHKFVLKINFMAALVYFIDCDIRLSRNMLLFYLKNVIFIINHLC